MFTYLLSSINLKTVDSNRIVIPHWSNGVGRGGGAEVHYTRCCWTNACNVVLQRNPWSFRGWPTKSQRPLIGAFNFSVIRTLRFHSNRMRAGRGTEVTRYMYPTEHLTIHDFLQPIAILQSIQFHGQGNFKGLDKLKQ